MDPRTAYARKDCILIDIRPFDERYDLEGLGFIPTSLSVPGEEAHRALLDTLLEQAGMTPVLYCATGRRSAALQTTLRQQGVHVEHLDGGILAWTAEGLPVVATRDTSHTPYVFSTGREAVRYLTSCYVGQLTETLLDAEEPDSLAENPREVFLGLFEQEGVSMDSPNLPGLLRVLDRAALHSRRQGTSLRDVNENLSIFANLLLLSLKESRHEAVSES